MQKQFKGTVKYLTLILSLSAALIGCEQATKQATIQENKQENKQVTPASKTVIDYSAAPVAFVDAQAIRQSALDVATRATAWQLARLDNFDYIPASKTNKKIADPKEWIQGAFFIGLTRWADTVNDENIVARMGEIAKDTGYQTGHRPLHGDEHAIGQAYLWLHEKTGNKATYAPIQATFDNILANPPTNSLEFFESDVPGFEGTCQDRWCWADALFMAPRTWMQLSTATGDSKYFDYANEEYWATADYLFSDDYGLFFRDSRYFTKKSDNGNPVFWGRGNGWVFAALPLIIEEIPEGHKSKKRYLELYTKMAKALVKLQNPNGFWPASLMDAEKVKTPETSGSGFINFGLAWGVNNGVVTDQATIEAVEKGWAALASTVDAEGMMHWVQQIGKSPDPVSFNDTQLYGVGALLLAASEMSQWELPAKEVKAYGRAVPERIDDFAWENDKVAFRVYGPAAKDTGVSNGVDTWFKKVDYSVIDKWYLGHTKGISYHKDKGEGYDPYHTGISSGVGSTVIWVDGKAYRGGAYKSVKVLKSGDTEVAFTLQYEFDTPLGKVAESKTISLGLGEQLFTVNSIFTLDGSPASLPIAVGVATHDEKASVSFNKATGRISALETIDGLGVGTGALVEPSIVTDIKHLPSDNKDESHIWLFTNSDKQGKLAYRAGFAWQASGDITTANEWQQYLDSLASK